MKKKRRTESKIIKIDKSARWLVEATVVQKRVRYQQQKEATLRRQQETGKVRMPQKNQLLGMDSFCSN